MTGVLAVRILSLVLAGSVLMVGMPASARESAQFRSLLKEARLVAAGDIERVTTYEDGRVAVAELRITKLLKGRLTPPAERIAIIEMRELPTPPVFAPGQRGIVFLGSAQRSTSLAQALPQGTYWQPLKRELGFLVAASPDEHAENEKIIDTMLATSRTPESDPAAREASHRRIVFSLISARNPRLVDDGAATLATIPNLAASLTDDEKAQLARALQRADLPPRTRVALIDAVGENRLAQLAPTLAQLDTPPVVLDAAWKALGELGVPPSDEQLEAHLTSPDPLVRAAAARALLRRDGVDAVKRVGPLAIQDPDRSVRLAAIVALGELKKPEALPPLERVFSSDDGDLQRAAGRAIVMIGGDAGADALARLAFDAPPGAQRYALLILMTTVGPNDPRVQRIATSHPSIEMRQAVNKPFEFHSHAHNEENTDGAAAH